MLILFKILIFETFFVVAMVIVLKFVTRLFKMHFEFRKKLSCCVRGRDQSKNFGFIKRVDKTKIFV